MPSPGALPDYPPGLCILLIMKGLLALEKSGEGSCHLEASGPESQKLSGFLTFLAIFNKSLLNPMSYIL